MPPTPDGGDHSEADRPVVVVVRGRLHPHEVMLTVISGVFAAVWLTGTPLPASLSATARLAVVGFFVLSGLGFVAGIAAIVFRRLPVLLALRLEQGANLFIAAAGLLYVYAVVALSGWAAWLVILLIGCVWVIGSIWRAAQLFVHLRDITKGSP